MISFADFRTKYQGKFIDFDGVYGYQCADENNQYLVDVLGVPNPIQLFPGATAFEIYQNFQSNNQFTKVDNTPDGVPPTGAMLFLKPNIAGITGNAGHVCQVITADINKLNTFGQNYPTDSPCQEQEFDYTAVAGWIIANASTTSPDALQECLKQHDALVQLSNQKDVTIDQLTKGNEDKQKQIDLLTQQVQDFTTQNQELTKVNTSLKINVSSVQKQNADLHQQMSDQLKSDSTAIDLGIEAELKLKDQTAEINKLASAMGTEYPPMTNLILAYQNLQKQHATQIQVNQNNLNRFQTFFTTFINGFFKRK